MAHLIQEDNEGDVKCSDCETVFMVVWNRNPIYDRIEYCPFCGDEISYKTERGE